MAAKDTRPVNLDLTKFSFPITAIASIMHRICAVISWVGLGIALFVAQRVQSSPEGAIWFAQLMADNFLAQFIAWGLLSAFSYYCAATVKHIVQELGYCEDFAGGQRISWAALAFGATFTVLAGVYLWA